MEKPFDAQRLIGPWTNRIAIIGAVGILLTAAVIVLDVLARWLFNSPIIGVDDLGTLMLAVVVSSFFPVGLTGGHFVTIRFLGKGLGQRAGGWLEVLGGTGTLLVFIVLAWQFFRFTLFDVTLTGLATVVLELPQAPWWWVVTAIIVVCVPIQAVVLVDAILRVASGRPPAYESRLGKETETGG